MKRISHAVLAKYIAGEVTASKAEEIEEKLERSSKSRGRLNRMGSVLDHLGDTSDIDDIDLLPSIQTRLDGLDATPPRALNHRLSRTKKIGLVAAVILALALPLVWLTNLSNNTETDSSEFRAKSALKTADKRSRWIALNVYQLSGESEPHPLGDILTPEDGLLFTYSNLGPTPFSHLMIFAVDSSKEVYWYYPAYLDEHSNPNSIGIPSGVSRKGLQEVIAHPYKKGKLTILGLFSDKKLFVSDIENSIHQGVDDKAGFEQRFPGTRAKVLEVQVEQ